MFNVLWTHQTVFYRAVPFYIPTCIVQGFQFLRILSKLVIMAILVGVEGLLVFFFLAALGLRCCAWAFSSCNEQGLPFVVVHGLLIAVASLVAEHRL